MLTHIVSNHLWRPLLVLLLVALAAGSEGEARTAAWEAWNAAEAGDREAIPRVRAHLDGAGTDPDGHRTAMIALDSLIRLGAAVDIALIRRADGLGAHVQALILAARAGEEGQVWAREAAGRIGDTYERTDQLALLDMVASQRTAAAAAILWRDSTAALTVVVRDPPDANELGPLGMFGSRSGGGRKRRAEQEPWPEVASYRLRRQAGDPLPALRYHFGWERTLHAAGGGTRPEMAQQVRLDLLAAMAHGGVERPVTAPEMQRRVWVEWRPGLDVTAAVRTAQGQYHADWARFLAGLAAAGFAPAAPVVQFQPLELVDARRSGQETLNPVDGATWRLSPPPPIDPQELRQRKAAEQEAWDQERRRMDASLEAFLKEVGAGDPPTAQ